MTPLDEHERSALSQFLRLLAEEQFDPRPQVEEGHIVRGPEGQIIVPVTLNAAEPSLSLGLLMAQKAEHLYKQTGCRLVLTQRPQKDPTGRSYVWAAGSWRSLE
jgi:hypothetical protein